MTDQRIAEITARCEAATPGPWTARKNRHPQCNGEPWGWIDGAQENTTWSGKRGQVNAAFIAHARQDIPYLLSQLAAKDAEIERLREAQRWIPVTERLPEVWQGEYGEPLEFNVMLAEGTEATTMCFDGSQWFEMIWSEMKRGENFAVTHWQPIPAAPGEGESK